MIELQNGGAYLVRGRDVVPDGPEAADRIRSLTGQTPDQMEAARNTIAYRILEAHNTSGNMEQLKIRFDKMISHDITFVGIIQTARASGLEKFPIPYVLTNCHNSLCAVGGTINEDDHMFGLSCAKRYGGAYVPPHQAVIHQYAREMMSGGGKMILGSDSHTRYGALGTMAMGEGGPELVKQLLNRTYDIPMPGVVGVYLTGEPVPGVGPQDIALAIIGAVFEKGYVKNKVMEFVGPGVSSLSADYRIGVDVMTTETTCLSSIWRTDSIIRDYYEEHGRPEEYRELNSHVGNLTAAYELYLTSQNQNALVDCLVICGNEVVGYISDKKSDPRFAADHLQKMLRADGFKTSVHMLTDIRKFTERMDSLNAHADELRSGLSFKPDPAYEGYGREDMIRHCALNVSL